MEAVVSTQEYMGTIIHSRAELKNTSLTTSRPKQLHLENHVFQQLNHFPSPSPDLSFGWREVVERLAGGDGSTQHRCPWTTLTTSHGQRCGSTSWPQQDL